MSLLSTLLKTYFARSALDPRRLRVLATILPGATSSLCKLVSPSSSERGNKGARSDVVVLALRILQDLSASLFRDDTPATGSTSTGISNLADLQTWIVDEDDVPHATVPPSPTLSAQSLSSLTSTTSTADTSLTTPSTSAPPPQSQLVVLTPSWSSFTLHQLHPALVSLTHLRRHQHPTARRALADLSGALLQECTRAFEESWTLLTGNLLILAGDDFPAVSGSARKALSTILQQPSARVILLPSIRQHLMDALFTLPFLLRSPGQTANERILAACRLVTATATVSELESLVEGILGPLGGIEKWSGGLLDCLEFTAVGAMETEVDVGRRSELAWVAQTSTATPVDSNPTARLRLSNLLDPVTEKAFTGMLFALGAAGGEDALFSVEHFISVSSPPRLRTSMRSVAGVWCAERVLEGIISSVEASPASRKGKGRAADSVSPGKRTRKVVRALVRNLLRSEEEDADVDSEEAAVGAQTATDNRSDDMQVGAQQLEDSLMPTEYVKGLNPLTTLLDRPTSSSSRPSTSQSAPVSPEVVRTLRTVQILSLLVTSSSVLSTGFRPLLLHSLYYLLSHLSSTSHMVASAALDAISRIAYHTGYASSQNLVLENTDYVINVVSQRLTSQRLDLAAPAVLISMIHLVGSEIVPLVHDIVDEIIDALDAYHGYEVLASTLLAVLDALLKVMLDEATVAASDGLHRPAFRVKSEQPDPTKDLSTFKTWYVTRHDRAKDDIEEIRLRPPTPLEPAPQEPWGKDPDADEPDDGQEADTSAPDADGPLAPKPTRSQDICTQILGKALFFLTHSSPFLRARVLSLFQSAILVLAPAGLEAQLLPIVNRAWPYILNRVSDSESYVVLEAIRVLEVLANECGDFVAGRVRDEGWPLIKRLLERRLEDDRSSSLVLRNQRRSTSGNPLHGSSTTQYSTTHRLYASALATLTGLVKGVPITPQIRWEILVLSRPFLDNAVHDRLRQQAQDLMVALGRIDPDSVWAGLTATVAAEGRSLEEERLGWLREVGWDVRNSVELVVGQLVDSQ